MVHYEGNILFIKINYCFLRMHRIWRIHWIKYLKYTKIQTVEADAKLQSQNASKFSTKLEPKCNKIYCQTFYPEFYPVFDLVIFRLLLFSVLENKTGPGGPTKKASRMRSFFIEQLGDLTILDVRRRCIRATFTLLVSFE